MLFSFLCILFFKSPINKVSVKILNGVVYASGEEAAENDKPQRSRSPPKKKRRILGYKEDPFVFFSEEEELWPQIRYLFYSSDSVLTSYSSFCFFSFELSEHSNLVLRYQNYFFRQLTS